MNQAELPGGEVAEVDVRIRLVDLDGVLLVAGPGGRWAGDAVPREQVRPVEQRHRAGCLRHRVHLSTEHTLLPLPGHEIPLVARRAVPAQVDQSVVQQERRDLLILHLREVRRVTGLERGVHLGVAAGGAGRDLLQRHVDVRVLLVPQVHRGVHAGHPGPELQVDLLPRGECGADARAAGAAGARGDRQGERGDTAGHLRPPLPTYAHGRLSFLARLNGEARHGPRPANYAPRPNPPSRCSINLFFHLILPELTQRDR